ncbi:MAG: hypothetical protein K2X82_10985 [Gemmataceae bacterium]|nr:hypothetical protein [Gemmataceae bacterium]
MTEADWRASDDAVDLYLYLQLDVVPRYRTARTLLTRRLGALFGVACVRATPAALDHPPLVRAAEAVERAADGGGWADVGGLNREAEAACDTHTPESPAHHLAMATLRLTGDDVARCSMHVPLFLLRASGGPAAVPGLRRAYADALRDVYGHAIRGSRGRRMKRPAGPYPYPVLREDWVTSAVAALAEGIYADQAFHHLPVLADALEDAGCTDEAIVAHCRGPGPHVRGCWVVDLVLGKS